MNKLWTVTVIGIDNGGETYVVDCPTLDAAVREGVSQYNNSTGGEGVPCTAVAVQGAHIAHVVDV